MAKRKFSRKRTHPKRRTRRRFRKRRAVRRLRRPNLNFKAFTAVFKTKYTETKVTPGSSAYNHFVFRANTTYDPDFAAGGSSTANRQLAYARYDHGTVIGSKIVIRCPSSTIPLILVVRTSDDAATISDVQHLMNMDHSQWKLMPFGDSRTYTMTHRWSARKWYGKSTSSIIGDSRFIESVATLPNEGMYYHVSIFSADGVTFVPANMVFAVQINYHCVMSEPKVIAEDISAMP